MAEVHTAQGETLLSLFIIPVQCGEEGGGITCKHLLGDRLAMAMQGVSVETVLDRQIMLLSSSRPHAVSYYTVLHYKVKDKYFRFDVFLKWTQKQVMSMPSSWWEARV